MQPNNEIFLGDKLIGRANSVTVHKSSAVGKNDTSWRPSPGASEQPARDVHVRRWQWPSLLPTADPRRDERAAPPPDRGKYLFLTGAM